MKSFQFVFHFCCIKSLALEKKSMLKNVDSLIQTEKKKLNWSAPKKYAETAQDGMLWQVFTFTSSLLLLHTFVGITADNTSVPFFFCPHESNHYNLPEILRIFLYNFRKLWCQDISKYCELKCVSGFYGVWQWTERFNFYRATEVHDILAKMCTTNEHRHKKNPRK